MLRFSFAGRRSLIGSPTSARVASSLTLVLSPGRFNDTLEALAFVHRKGWFVAFAQTRAAFANQRRLCRVHRDVKTLNLLVVAEQQPLNHSPPHLASLSASSGAANNASSAMPMMSASALNTIRSRVKLCDFGCARQQVGALVGAPCGVCWSARA